MAERTAVQEGDFKKLQQLLLRLQRMEGWKEPTLQDGWENYGSGFAPAGYCKDIYNTVYIRGTVKSGSVGESTAIFTLPKGYRPPYRLQFAVETHAAFGEVDITAEGVVIPKDVSALDCSINGIIFRAE